MKDVSELTLVGNRYQLTGLVHRDETVAVYAARDQDAGQRPVRLTMLLADMASSPAARQAFAAGVDRAWQIHHHGLAPLLFADLDAEQPYYVEARPAGRSLRERLDDGQTWVWDEALHLLEALADITAVIHRAGLVHGGIDARTVYIDDVGQATLSDLARGSSSLRSPEGLLHAAPELLAGAAPTPRSDVYSLASLGFTLLTGGPPFERNEATALRRVKEVADPPSLLRLRPDLPDELVTTLDAGLSRDPAHRPGSAAALREALRHGLPTIPVHEPPPAVWPKVVAALAGVAALAMLAWLLLTAPVPNVLGLPEAKARQALEDSGLDTRIAASANDTTAAPGTVTGQSPLPGKRVSRGFDVALSVAGSGSMTAPALLGLTESSARQILADNGLRLGRVDVAPAPGFPLGQVIGQAPLAGEPLQRGDFVSLVLSGDIARTVVVPVIEDGLDPQVVPVPEINVTVTPPAAPAAPASPIINITPPAQPAEPPAEQRAKEPEPPALPEPPSSDLPEPPPPGDGQPQPVPPNRPQPPSGPAEPVTPASGPASDR